MSEKTLQNTSDPALHTVVLGKGSPILLLHGWGHSHRTLYGLGELLSEHAEVHLIDLPGFGSSQPPPDVWSSRDYAKRIFRYLDERRIESVDVLGHSFGGKVGIGMSLLAPERVRSLILCNSAGLKRERTGREGLRYQFVRTLRTLIKTSDKLLGTKLFQDWFIPRFASADYQSAGQMRSILVRSVNEDLTPDISVVRTATLLLWGTRDTETPIEMGRRMHQLISGSQLIELPGIGHNPFDFAGYHLVTYYLRPFLKQLDDGGDPFRITRSEGTRG